MKCSVSTCKKEMETPLILFNGDLVCPFCGNPLVNDVIEFKITKKSEELFKLSEILFYNSFEFEDKETRDNYIKSAIEKCNDAMEMGHPQAYIRMGYYYDKDYLELNRSEAVRTKIAYQYYSAIVYSHSNNISFEDGVEIVSLVELKKTAANYMLKMLLDFNDEEQSSEKYSYEYNSNKIKELLNYSLDDSYRENSFITTGNIQKILTTLNGCKNKKRAPVLGIYTLLNKYELKNLFEAKEKIVFDLIDVEKINLLCYKYAKNNRVGGESYSLSTKKQVDALVKELKDEDKLALVFFNKKNGHKLLKRSDLKEIEKVILQKDYIQMHINNIYSKVERFYERVYHDDDIYYYKLKNKNIKGAIEALCGAR